jgi:hypothetical protein
MSFQRYKLKLSKTVGRNALYGISFVIVRVVFGQRGYVLICLISSNIWKVWDLYSDRVSRTLLGKMIYANYITKVSTGIECIEPKYRAISLGRQESKYMVSITLLRGAWGTHLSPLMMRKGAHLPRRRQQSGTKVICFFVWPLLPDPCRCKSLFPTN